MKMGEIAIGVLFLTVAVVAFVMAGEFASHSNVADPGPAMYPRLTAALTGLFAIGVIWNALTKRQGKEVGSEDRKWWLAILTFGIAVAYLLIFEVIGYIISTFGLLLVIMMLGGVRNRVQLAAVPAIYVAFTYYLFSSILMLKLP